ncbi:MAG: response regulator, partial [Muribaculaceae bacterium]|nr:response regulator [Muribaculaceae bacterium]
VDEHDPVGAAFTRMRFTVADNGIGMPPEFLERLFDPFERSDQTVVENIQGTGLGMSISKSLAEAMGGAISVESEVGKGSTFTLVLDLMIGDNAEAAAESDIVVQPERYEFEGRRFLLAEDNEINALVFMGLVGEEGLGAQVDWAENGQQAVEMFAERPAGYYSAVFMDVMMPVMGGYAATAAIRALPREDASEVRIIALTANAFAEDVQAALDAGMNAHVSKPIVLDELEHTLLKM